MQYEPIELNEVEDDGPEYDNTPSVMEEEGRRLDGWLCSTRPSLAIATTRNAKRSTQFILPVQSLEFRQELREGLAKEFGPRFQLVETSTRLPLAVPSGSKAWPCEPWQQTLAIERRAFLAQPSHFPYSLIVLLVLIVLYLMWIK